MEQETIEACSGNVRAGKVGHPTTYADTAIRANLAALGAQAHVRREDALRFLDGAARASRHYDLVFLDPPYRFSERLGPPLSEALPAVLAPAAVVVAESDRRAPLTLGLPLHDERRYGDTLIRLHGP